MIKELGYQAQQKTEKRRKIITNAILKHSFDTILQQLKRISEQENGYKNDRILNDLSWMRKQHRKGRYNSTLLTQKQEDGKTIFHKSTTTVKTR